MKTGRFSIFFAATILIPSLVFAEPSQRLINIGNDIEAKREYEKARAKAADVEARMGWEPISNVTPIQAGFNNPSLRDTAYRVEMVERGLLQLPEEAELGRRIRGQVILYLRSDHPFF